MSAFIVNTTLNNVVGFVQNIEGASEKIGDKAGANTLLVATAKDLEALSLQQLTDLYNTYVGPDATNIAKFKIAKDKAAERVFALLNKIDLTLLAQLDAEEEKVIEAQATVVASKEVEAAKLDANGKKVRKVRDSKLQRMKNCFLTKNEDGTYKTWTVKELMEKAGTTERITHVYISILRSKSDRFVMDIEKNAEAGTYVYKPKVDAAPAAEQAEEQQPAA